MAKKEAESKEVTYGLVPDFSHNCWAVATRETRKSGVVRWAAFEWHHTLEQAAASLFRRLSCRLGPVDLSQTAKADITDLIAVVKRAEEAVIAEVRLAAHRAVDQPERRSRRVALR